ncbi:MAG: cytochrome c family protein [Ignavibacteriales bacterium]|nr:cytochrome c family protein [Ignavibacteriales bacterium]
MKGIIIKIILLASLFYFLCGELCQQVKAGDNALGTRKYEDFSKAKFCGTSCHNDFFQQWKQSMMSQAYTHHWDEIEYFKLAVPHAEKDPIVAGVKAGCNGCHSPIAFLAGDVPPPLPEKMSMANESVNCDVCHTVTGFEGDTPYNFNFISSPGRLKYGPRGNVEFSGTSNSKIRFFKFMQNFAERAIMKKVLMDIWVKSTHLEWKEGPYAKEGVKCHNCHMTNAPVIRLLWEIIIPMLGSILFHGAHDPGKVKGTVELRIHPDLNEAEPGERVKFTVALVQSKNRAQISFRFC